jgi:hypothetical protein
MCLNFFKIFAIDVWEKKNEQVGCQILFASYDGPQRLLVYRSPSRFVVI